MNIYKLPPLPEPDHSLDCGDQPFYRPDQMQAYAIAAVNHAAFFGARECKPHIKESDQQAPQKGQSNVV